MNLFGKWRHGPLRIRSSRELDPTYRTRWERTQLFCLKCFFAGLLLIALAGFSKFAALAWLGGAVTLLPLTLMFSVEVGVPVLLFLGYWFPRLAVRAAAIDAWFERDLDRGQP
ncbi:MAG: hypothetical protein AB3N23_14130 [Paracoccaceae bacterium]